jgi:ADP-heptose:LPS heptosyltransferase
MPAKADAIESEINKVGATSVQYFPTSDIHELVALIRHCSLVITPDTSVAHIASAEHKPILGFYFGVSEWLPFRSHSYIVMPPVGQPIATIPFDPVAYIADMCIRELDGEIDEVTRLVRSERPFEIEVLTPVIEDTREKG